MVDEIPIYDISFLPIEKFPTKYDLFKYLTSTYIDQKTILPEQIIPSN